MSTSEVTICIPCYNARTYLAETLESVRAQTFRDWSLIVVEDGSKDPVEDLVQAFADSVDQPVTYLRHEANKGLPQTRNTAMKSAFSPWLAPLDSDDVWLPNHLASCMAVARETHADIVHSGCDIFDSTTGKSIQDRVPTQEDLSDARLSIFQGTYIIQPSSVILSRAMWEKVGGFDLRFYCEDKAMWFRCLRSGATVRYTGEITCRYRKHDQAMTANSLKLSEALTQLYEAHIDWIDIPLSLRREKCANEWASFGRLSRHANPRGAARAFRKSLSHRWDCETAARYLHAAITSRFQGSAMKSK